jgi:hypothetical protein
LSVELADKGSLHCHEFHLQPVACKGLSNMDIG